MVDRVEEYLAYRRRLGYQLRIEGQMLLSFARYADAAGHRGPLTTELALRWARLPARPRRLYQARRLEVVRCFARYLRRVEPGHRGPAPRAARPGPRAGPPASHLLRGRARRPAGRGRAARGRRPACAPGPTRR